MSQISKENIEPVAKTDFSKKKINPIKKYVIQQNGLKAKSHRIKRIQARIWRFDPIENIIDQRTLKRAIFGLRLQRKLQKVSIRWPMAEAIEHNLTLTVQKLASLQRISLDFSWCGNVKDVGLNDLGQSLRRLISLQHLSLNFSQDYKITDAGFNDLIRGLQNLTSLKLLSLTFCGCDDITDSGLNSLTRIFQNFTSLQYIRLNFSECGGLTDDGLDYLREGLEQIVSLKKQSLNFAGCMNITDPGLDWVL